MSKDFVVTLHGARGDEWEQVLGTRSLFVQSPVPVMVRADGDEPEPAYLLDLEMLTTEQYVALVGYIALKFGLDEAEVERLIPTTGVPILARETTLWIQHALRWVN